MKRIKKLPALIKISRPVNALMTFLSIVIASVVCTIDDFSYTKVFLAASAGALTAIGGNIINDIYDIEIDKINMPERPLAKGILSKKEAVVFYITVNIISLTLSIFPGVYSFIIVLTAEVILFFYSYILKGIILAGNISVAFLTGLAFFYGGVVVANWKYSLLPAGFAFLINLIREIIKDMQDIAGDSQQGVITLPQKYGFGFSKRIIAGLSILLVAATIFPFFLRMYKIEFLIIVMVLVNPMLIYSLKLLFDEDSTKNLKKISSIYKLNMVIGLIAIYFGK
ncbi:MAG: geranylgeranylglycerol-phosphate geranylgeranyltransferase [Ignavibacteriaceae bacterium]